MTSEPIVAALDIGTAYTTAIVAAVHGDLPRTPTLRVLGVGHTRTMGLRRGVVSDIEEATRSIRKAVEEASRVAGVTPDALYVGIAGEHVRAMCSTGVVAISGNEILRTDVDRVNEVARAMAIPQDRELLHAIPQEYRVDKTDGIRDPVGMIGTRLETEMYLVTIGSSPAMNLRKSIERAGFKTRELVLEPLASALAVLTEEEKEQGVVLLELGAGTTDLAVFHEGKIRHLGTIASGGNAVTSDLVQGLGITNQDAELLKEAYGCAYEPMVDSEQVIAMPATASHGERHISRELMTHIIHQRMDEIFDKVQREVQVAGFAGRLNAGVVLTGGGAALEGISELAADVFGLGVRVGVPGENVSGLVEQITEPRFATAVGLALYGAHRVALGGVIARRPSLTGAGVDKLATRVKTWLQDWF
ncbi:MAG: cell division protein FtsA [Gemmatimonadota bacterium]|jgi:cell division protein FtsA|nr:cell division protein FtsA [Gemmatimonadota bacterium]MDQ8167646.1 cell division protein FtsA [Gemmatimonadota bacterium]MDQ8172333.1 cell division protein FtsA [Gemmatimonadota bacterium]